MYSHKYKISLIFKTIQNTDEDGIVNTKVVTTLQARKIAQEELNASLAKEKAQLEKDIAKLQLYETALKEGEVDTDSFAGIMKDTSSEAQEYAAKIKDGTGSTQLFAEQQKKAQAELKATANASKGTSVAIQTLSAIGNMATMWAISKGIELAVKAIDNAAHSAEYCKKRVNELMDSYESKLNTANSNARTVENLAERYEELSKGVNDFGENISLTAGEYDEYHNIVNQIADMFPNLIQSYTEEGNAILSLKGNVEKLRDAYKEAQQEAYNMLIISGGDSNSDDIISNYQNTRNSKEPLAWIPSWVKDYILPGIPGAEMLDNMFFAQGEPSAKDIIDIVTRLSNSAPDELNETLKLRTWILAMHLENSIFSSDSVVNVLQISGGFQHCLNFRWYAIDEDINQLRNRLFR